MNSLTMVVHTTVSPHALTEEGGPHVVRKGAELSVSVSLNGNLPMAMPLDLVAQLITEGGQPITKLTDEGSMPLSSVTRYVLRAGQTTAVLRPRINLLSSALEGADTTHFRIRVAPINVGGVEPAYSPLIVVRSKWPAKNKREAVAGAPAPAPASSCFVAPEARKAAAFAASSPDSSSADTHDAMDLRGVTFSLDAAGLRSHRSSDGTDGHVSLAPVAEEARQPSDPLSSETLLDASDLEEMLQLLGEGGDELGIVAALDDALAAAPAPAPPSRPPPAAPVATLLAPGPQRASLAAALPVKTVHCVMPSSRATRTRTTFPLHGPDAHEGEAAALHSFEAALEGSRHKRRPLALQQAPQPGLGTPRGLLPAWLDRVSLCKASGFVCLELVPKLHGSLAPTGADGCEDGGALLARAQALGVRWASANMNSALGVPLDRMLQAQPLLDLFAPDARAAVQRAAAELLCARGRAALDCGILVLSLPVEGDRRLNAVCHVMLHTDGTPEGSLSVPKLFALVRLHSHALGGSRLLTFEHSSCVDAPREEGDVVRRLFAGRVHFASPSMPALCGFEPWQFLGREAGCSVHPDDASRWCAYKLEVSRRLHAEPGKWIEHVFTHRHVHRLLGWVWVHCATQSRLARPQLRVARPASVEDSLACALHEVVVRTRPADELGGLAGAAGPAPPLERA